MMRAETDAGVLDMLRRDSSCPQDVRLLAERAAAKQLLVGCYERASTATQADMIDSSNSSRTILAARVPDPDSTLENVPRTYYARLRWELQTALGLLPSPLFGDD